MANRPPSDHRAPKREYYNDESFHGHFSAPPRQTAPRKKRRKSRTFNPAGRIFGVLFLAALAVIGGYAGWAYRKSQAMREYGSALFSGVTVADAFPNANAMNLMIIGRDYDYNNQDQVIRTHARSDMLMVARVDFANKTVKILSIPRDTAAAIPGHGITKINAAHAYGGPTLAEQTVLQNFGIPSDHYIALDFQGFQEAIDEIGGVSCVVDKKMDYDDDWGHLHIHLLPGYQHLDGEQAMGFVRFRHSDSDLIRTQRQQTLLAALKLKLVQPQTLALLPTLLDTIDKHVDSDLSDRQRIALALFLHGLPKDNVQMATMPSIEGGELVENNYVLSEPIVKSWFGVTMPPPLTESPRRHPRYALRRRIRPRSERNAA